jgi:hypothetical protein
VEKAVSIINKMKKSSKSYWSRRILAQLEYAMDIDPAYVAVTLERLENIGLAVEKLEG